MPVVIVEQVVILEAYFRTGDLGVGVGHGDVIGLRSHGDSGRCNLCAHIVGRALHGDVG